MCTPNLKSFITSLILFLCLHFAAVRVDAQEAYKIDEMTNPRCELSEVPVIDPPPYGKFATAVYNNPDLRGAIVIYGLQGNVVHYSELVKWRMTEVAGIAANRLVAIYGGHSEDTRMELWVVPKGAAEPKPNFAEDTRSARKFAWYAYWNGELCAGNRGPTLYEFGKALKQRQGWQGYIIIRPHRNKRGSSMGDEGWDPDGYISHQQALRRLAKDKSYLIKKFGLASTRLKAVIGDNDKWTHAELWLIPPGAQPPKPKNSSRINTFVRNHV